MASPLSGCAYLTVICECAQLATEKGGNFPGWGWYGCGFFGDAKLSYALVLLHEAKTQFITNLIEKSKSRNIRGEYKKQLTKM
jgi:hypothetical protein